MQIKECLQEELEESDVKIKTDDQIQGLTKKDLFLIKWYDKTT